MYALAKRVLNGLRGKKERAPAPPLARKIKERNLTYLSDDKFISLDRELRRIHEDGVAGAFAEFGIALGGSAIYLARHGQGRKFFGFDVFDMIPPPSERDGQDTHRRYEVIKSGKSQGIGGDRYYGYEENLYDKVVQNFKDFDLEVDGEQIILKKGLFEDTVRFAPSDTLSLAHIDCDWYDPVRFCMNAVSPLLSQGGVILLDDYNDYGGCRDAATDMLAADKSLQLIRSEPHAVILKT